MTVAWDDWSYVTTRMNGVFGSELMGQQESPRRLWSDLEKLFYIEFTPYCTFIGNSTDGVGHRVCLSERRVGVNRRFL